MEYQCYVMGYKAGSTINVLCTTHTRDNTAG